MWIKVNNKILILLNTWYDIFSFQLNVTIILESHRAKHLRDHLQPPWTSAPSCIFLQLNAQNFNLKPNMRQLLPQFHVLKNINPYVCLWEFKELFATFQDQNCSIEIISVKNVFIPIKRQRSNTDVSPFHKNMARDASCIFGKTLPSS